MHLYRMVFWKGIVEYDVHVNNNDTDIMRRIGKRLRQVPPVSFVELSEDGVLYSPYMSTLQCLANSAVPETPTRR